MPGRSRIAADAREQAEPRALARSSRRGEADRARAVLPTLAGRRAAEIAAALGAHVGTVREWRGSFGRGRVAALRQRGPPGRPGVTGARAGDLAEAILAEDADHAGGWTLPRLGAGVRRRGGPAISAGWLSRQLRERGLPGVDRGTRSRGGGTPLRSSGAAAGSPP